MKNIYLFILIACFLTSCSNQEKRILLLEKELNLELGTDYKVVQDDDISHNGFESDYTLIVKVELSKIDIDRIVKKLKTEPYFNQLAKFKNEDRSTTISGIEDHQYYKKATDSLKKTKYRGSWFKTDKGFKFVDLGNKLEPIDAEINLKEQTLKFVFNHL